MEQALKDIIIEAVNEDYLLEIEDETLVFLNETPRSMIGHLRNRGGALDFADTKTLLNERDQEWDASEVPTIYFNRVEKAMQQLTRARITSDLKERTDMALYYFKNTGEYDAAVREWEAKPVATKTWTNIKLFMSTEYAKESKKNKQSANQLKADAIEEQAEATEELIANLTEVHTRQVESLIKANTEAMKEMMSLFKDKTITPTNPTNPTNEEKKKKREERQKKFTNAPVCKHCGKKHPSKTEDECWELDKNAASRQPSWKSTKNNRRCTGSQVESEVWQPGKVILDKITTNHAYLAATNYWTPLQSNETEEDEKEEDEANITYKIPIKEIPKPNKWERRLPRRIEKRLIIDSGATSHFCSKEMDLPKEGESNKAVYLPN